MTALLRMLDVMTVDAAGLQTDLASDVKCMLGSVVVEVAWVVYAAAYIEIPS